MQRTTRSIPAIFLYLRIWILIQTRAVYLLGRKNRARAQNPTRGRARRLVCVVCQPSCVSVGHGRVRPPNSHPRPPSAVTNFTAPPPPTSQYQKLKFCTQNFHRRRGNTATPGPWPHEKLRWVSTQSGAGLYPCASQIICQNVTCTEK